MSQDLFVSYSSKDKLIADSIVASMEKNNIRCWYAPRDIKPGENWGNAILNAIENSTVFLIVFSGNANHSQRVLDELNIAISEEITILPFRVENFEPKGAMKLHLTSHHWLDAYDPSWEVHINRLIKSVSIILNSGLDADKIQLPETVQRNSQQHKRHKLLKVLVGAAIPLVLVTAAWFGYKAFFPLNQDTILAEISNSDISLSQSITTSPTQTIIMSPTQTITPSPTQTAVLTKTASPVPKMYSTLVREKDNMTMIYVPAGDFIMGLIQDEIDWLIDQEWCSLCEQSMFETALSEHMVFLDDFWIDKSEVSNAQYALCVADDKCSQPFQLESHSRTQYYGVPQYDDYPVISVSWYQAQEYCRWAGGRLPTEAEWEKSARGTDGGYFPWGNDNPTNEFANFDRSKGDTTRVGSYSLGISPYGVLDMAGNVWEWVYDWWGYYDTRPTTNPSGPASGSYRVLRGGAWDSNPFFLLTAFRNGQPPEYAGYFVGFRCAQSQK
jgi:formylglycine-generating enzyme required for sulfatase activity